MRSLFIYSRKVAACVIFCGCLVLVAQAQRGPTITITSPDQAAFNNIDSKADFVVSLVTDDPDLPKDGSVDGYFYEVDYPPNVGGEKNAERKNAKFKMRFKTIEHKGIKGVAKTRFVIDLPGVVDKNPEVKRGDGKVVITIEGRDGEIRTDRSTSWTVTFPAGSFQPNQNLFFVFWRSDMLASVSCSGKTKP